MRLNPFQLYSPQSLKEVMALLSDHPKATLLAGGTFLINRLKSFKTKGLASPKAIISLRKIKEIKGLEEHKGCLTMGAMTTLTELYSNALIEKHVPLLKTVARNIGTSTIRNMATVGGNLTCRYTWTELPCVLLAMDATLHFASRSGNPETISIQDFLAKGAKTDSLLTQVSVPKQTHANLIYKRVSKNSPVDLPLLSLCIQLTVDKKKITEGRIAINNGMAYSQRDSHLEKFLQQKSISKNLPEEALEHLDAPLYDLKADEHKQYIFRVTLKNALKGLLGISS